VLFKYMALMVSELVEEHCDAARPIAEWDTARLLRDCRMLALNQDVDTDGDKGGDNVLVANQDVSKDGGKEEDVDSEAVVEVVGSWFLAGLDGEEVKRRLMAKEPLPPPPEGSCPVDPVARCAFVFCRVSPKAGRSDFSKHTLIHT
jgi:hypothetical protein